VQKIVRRVEPKISRVDGTLELGTLFRQTGFESRPDVRSVVGKAALFFKPQSGDTRWAGVSLEKMSKEVIPPSQCEISPNAT
jgi:hypothetical protein